LFPVMRIKFASSVSHDADPDPASQNDADPDTSQNDPDPQHWLLQWGTLLLTFFVKSKIDAKLTHLLETTVLF